MSGKVYLINQFDRWCPENNTGDYFVAAFSTYELAKDYQVKAREIEGSGGCWGFSIREFSLDTEIPVDYNVEDPDDKFNVDAFNKFLKEVEEREDEE